MGVWVSGWDTGTSRGIVARPELSDVLFNFLNFSFLIYRMEKIPCCPRDCGEDKITSIRESY